MLLCKACCDLLSKFLIWSKVYDWPLGVDEMPNRCEASLIFCVNKQTNRVEVFHNQTAAQSCRVAHTYNSSSFPIEVLPLTGRFGKNVEPQEEEFTRNGSLVQFSRRKNLHRLSCNCAYFYHGNQASEIWKPLLLNIIIYYYLTLHFFGNSAVFL